MRQERPLPNQFVNHQITRSSNGGQRDRGAEPSQGHARHPTRAREGRPLLSAEKDAALGPQRPVPDDRLHIVATGEKEDNVENLAIAEGIVPPTLGV